MVSKTDLRTNDTRQRVIQEAKRLYLTGGYNHLSMDRIAEVLGLKRPTLYYHFPGGKEQLLVETLNSTVDEMVGAWREALSRGHNASSRLRNILDVVAEHPIPENKRTILVELWQLGSEVQAAIKQSYTQIYNLLSQVFEEGIRQGEIKAVEIELLIQSFINIYDQVEGLIATKQTFPELNPLVNKYGLAELTDQIFELWIGGLRTSSAATP